MTYVKLNGLAVLLYSVLFGTFVVFTITFIAAYLSPGKSVIVDINSYGEANLELLLIVVTWIFLAYSLYYIYTQVKRRSVEEVF